MTSKTIVFFEEIEPLLVVANLGYGFNNLFLNHRVMSMSAACLIPKLLAFLDLRVRNNLWLSFS